MRCRHFRNKKADMISDAIRSLLEADLNPPHDDYSHADFIAGISSTLSQDDRKLLAEEITRSLPCGIADDCFHALMEDSSSRLSVDDLMRLVPLCKHIDTAGMLIRIVLEYHAIVPDEVFHRVVAQYRQCSSSESRDRCAYAIWCIYNVETSDLTSGKVVGCLVSPMNEVIENLLNIDGVSDYSKRTLSACLR